MIKKGKKVTKGSGKSSQSREEKRNTGDRNILVGHRRKKVYETTRDKQNFWG